MISAADISIIIPLAPGETGHHELLPTLPADAEITLSQEAGGRAASLNAGARKATREYLWFLHADSRLAENTISALITAVKKHPDSLLFFDLAFSDDAAPLMRLNEWGAYFRSRVLKLPFGDQGFCIGKDLFAQLGGFPEGLEYGEDHVFVWRARQANIKIRPVNATLCTSARKYRIHGWLRTTLLHQYLWIKQMLLDVKKAP